MNALLRHPMVSPYAVLTLGYALLFVGIETNHNQQLYHTVPLSPNM